MVVARAAIATARERVRKIAWSAAAHRLRCGVGWLQSEQPVLPPMARICAAEGQRPADMPAQGNALGCRRRKRTSPERAAHVVAPFQGWSFSRWFQPLMKLDTNTRYVQYIKLAVQECGLGSEWVRAPRLLLKGGERKGVLKIIHDGIATRPKLPRAKSKTIR